MKLEQYLDGHFKLGLSGPPGCAKTARLEAATRKLGWNWVEPFRLSIHDRLDLSGAIVPDTKALVSRIFPLDKVKALREAIEPTVVCLDDMGQGPMDVQAAAMQLFDPGFLPDCVVIVGATNRPGDKAGVVGLCEPLRSRFDLFFEIATPDREEKLDGATFLQSWDEEVAQWCEHAFDRNWPAEVVAWHRATKGRTLYMWRPHADPAVRFPDYRTWETASKLLLAGITDNKSMAGAIGKPTAAEFLSFCQMSGVPTPDEVWMNPTGAPVPTEAGAMFLVTGNLARNVSANFAGAYIKYMQRLPRPYTVLGARDAFRRIGKQLSGSREWTSWFTENQELFAA